MRMPAAIALACLAGCAYSPSELAETGRAIRHTTSLQTPILEDLAAHMAKGC